MKTKIILIVLGLIVATLVGMFIGKALFGEEQPIGSVTTGQAYNATSTSSTLGITGDKLIKGGWGSLGSVVVTVAGDTKYNLFNATSSRAMNQEGFASSTNLLATIPENLAVGTYVFDVQYTDGLVIDIIGGTTASTTITFR